MSVSVLQDKVLLRPADVQPACPDFEVTGTFNPAAARYGNDIVLLVRVIERPRMQDPDRLVSPRAEWHDGRVKWIVDSFDSTAVEIHDPRIFRLPGGRVRLRYISHLRLARLSPDGLVVREVTGPEDLLPREPWEELGIEDPRITQIGDTYYITYVAISRHMGVATALMTTKDFQTFRRHGIIFPTENKDVVLLPEKWNGHLVAYHRPVSHHWVNAPSIETGFSPDGIFWGKHSFLFGPRPGAWDSVKVGPGPPPVRLPQGWLLIYHGVSSATPQSPVGHYCAGAAILDTTNPARLVARSVRPLLCPERTYETGGFVPNVVFPTGALLDAQEKELLLFVGCADEVVALQRLSIKSILKHLDQG